jgi:NAD(P)-dependent dehydrogenase (short-subunit alcohol dehydrogenase family)
MNEELARMFSLEGQVALITGGGSGLGYATAECMIEAGADVVLFGRREEMLQDACEKLGDKSSYRRCDITETDKIPALVEAVLEEAGRIDILVNNAGITCKVPIDEMPVEKFTEILNVHLVGAYAISKAVLPHMRARKSGNIVFTGSMASFFAMPWVAAYAVAKNGVWGLVRNFAFETATDGIRVNGIAPGYIDKTGIFKEATMNDPERYQRIVSRIPSHILGEPRDIGWATVYLCSSAAKYVNGHMLVVDGGASIGF